MILHHVAERTRFVVIAAATAFHAKMLGAGDLDVVDKAIVPEDFEELIGETQDHDVLRSFFAQVVIDPIGVLLGKGLVDDVIKMLGSRKIGAEGFFHHGATPAGFGLIQTRLAEVQQDVIEEFGSRGQIIKAIRARPFLLHRVEAFLESGVALNIAEFARVIGNALGKLGPEIVVVALAGNFLI